jgi:hypothetical protein
MLVVFLNQLWANFQKTSMAKISRKGLNNLEPKFHVPKIVEFQLYGQYSTRHYINFRQYFLK